MDLNEDEKQVFLAAVSSIASSLISLNEKILRITEEICPPNPVDTDEEYIKNQINCLREKGLSREEMISNKKIRDCQKCTGTGLMHQLSSISSSLEELTKEV